MRTTLSGIPIEEVYTAEHLPQESIPLPLPDEFPYTRGIHKEMYRRKLWTMRQFAGFGLPEDTNRRFRFLLQQGQTGLSVAFHLPTLMGVDSDDERAIGEVGKEGVAVDSLRDMEILFDGIDLEKITTSMTINGPAATIWAMMLVLAQKRGASWDKISGTIQNDILKEYTAQKTYIYPPEHGLKLVIDTFEFGTQHVPRWNVISISGYHIREAGSTAVQELSFTLANGFTYVQEGIRRGLDVNQFAPRLSFFFNAHLDFFEEIAKYRAARTLWAKALRDRFGATHPKAWKLRFHTQTAGCSLTAQQPENNIVRTAFQALSAVLGGTQSLHTNSMDETYALPTEKSVLLALRTQQLIAYETGVTETVDPLGGSYYVEHLTHEMAKRAEEYFEQIEKEGGVLRCIENGFFQKEIAQAAFTYQKQLEQQEKYHVGVNLFASKSEPDIETLKIDEEVEQKKRESLAALRRERDSEAVRRCLHHLKSAAEQGKNVMPFLCDAVASYATLGEVADTLKEVYGQYREPVYF